MGGVILLEGRSWSRTPPAKNDTADSGAMDGLLCGFPDFLLAVHVNPGVGSVLSAGAGGVCAFHGANESDVVTFSASVGLDCVCWLQEAWSQLVQAAKAGGWLLLLGVGGLLCYRLASERWPAPLSVLAGDVAASLLLWKRRRSSLHLDADAAQDAAVVDGQLVEDLFGREEDELWAIDFSLGLNSLCLHTKSKRVRKGAYSAQHIRTRWRHVTHRSHALKVTLEPWNDVVERSSLKELGREATIAATRLAAEGSTGSDPSSLDVSPDHAHRIRSYSLYQHHHDRSPTTETVPGWEGSVDSLASLAADVSEVSRLIRECSVDSDASDFSLNMSIHDGYGLGTLQALERIEAEVNNVKGNCLAINQEIFTLGDILNPPTDGVDPAASAASVTGASADLADVPVHRASFKGLLSLTTIPVEEGLSSDNSVADESPLHRPLRPFSLRSTSTASGLAYSEEDQSSLEWDNEGLAMEANLSSLHHADDEQEDGEDDDSVSDEDAVVPVLLVPGTGLTRRRSRCSSTLTATSERDGRSLSPATSTTISEIGLDRSGSDSLRSSANLSLDVRPSAAHPPAMWCSTESGYLDWEGGSAASSTGVTPGDASTTSSSVAALSTLPEHRSQEAENDSMSCTTSFYSLMSSAEDEEDPETSATSGAASAKDADNGGASRKRRSQWAETSKQNRDSAVYDVGVDVDAGWTEEAVGPRIQMLSLAESRWQAPSARACAVREAFAEVERTTGRRWMRRMRADHYGVLRAALFAMVERRLELPAAASVCGAIGRRLESGRGDWIRDWTFGHRLPYGAPNVMDGVRDCVYALERLMEELWLEQGDGAVESLVCRLNADVLLDTRCMEALKLHVLAAALELELERSLGEALPLFAMALFSRPDSADARLLAANYLDPVGDSAVLERAELYLLGHALGVRLEVYRPTAVTLDAQNNVQADLRTCYPDWESFSRFIGVIEEDDRHYSVPVP